MDVVAWGNEAARRKAAVSCTSAKRTRVADEAGLNAARIVDDFGMMISSAGCTRVPRLLAA